jgi:hypothetical protein
MERFPQNRYPQLNGLIIPNSKENYPPKKKYGNSTKKIENTPKRKNHAPN